jgi:tetratricopeptide (TPR) repeat protein
MISRPNYFSSTETAGASFFRLGWHLGRLRPLLLILALSATSVRASAGELEDCNGATAEKIEPACTTVISDTSRPADDRLKAYTNRARLHTSRSKLDLALSDVEAALQLNPQFVPALLLRGYLRQRSGSFDLARTDLDLAIELEPKNAIALLARGNLRSDQKAWAEALADFDQAILLRQDLAPAHVGRARAFVETAQFLVRDA